MGSGSFLYAVGVSRDHMDRVSLYITPSLVRLDHDVYNDGFQTKTHVDLHRPSRSQLQLPRHAAQQVRQMHLPVR